MKLYFIWHASFPPLCAARFLAVAVEIYLYRKDHSKKINDIIRILYAASCSLILPSDFWQKLLCCQYWFRIASRLSLFRFNAWPIHFVLLLYVCKQQIFLVLNSEQSDIIYTTFPPVFPVSGVSKYPLRCWSKASCVWSKEFGFPEGKQALVVLKASYKPS